jgi:hypothetical protein
VKAHHDANFAPNSRHRTEKVVIFAMGQKADLVHSNAQKRRILRVETLGKAASALLARK